jgi:PKD repeat protein
MRKLLISLILMILIIPLPLFSTTADDSEQLLTDDFGPNWLNTDLDLEKVESTRSRGVSVPPLQMQQAIGHIVDQVSEKYIEDYLVKLVGFGSRLYRAPGMANASKWLYEVLQGNGRIKAEYHNFSTTTSHGTFVLNNIILTIPGVNQSSDAIYYMYAHSDAVQMTDQTQWLTNTPGADDDGSGCVAALEAARVLSRYKFHDTIKFGFFQAEEIGLRGSAAYAQTMQARGENVPASIDYDMIGHSTGNPEYGLDLLYNAASSNIGMHMIGVNERYDIGLTLTAYLTSSSIPSDIQSFYNRGFPSVMGIETEFSPYYHSLSDLPKNINYSLIQKTTQMATASLSEWARLLYVDVSVPQGNMNISNDKPNEDDLVEVNVNISNKGNIDAYDLEVVFSADGEPFATKRIDVPQNGTNTTSATWSAVLGNHNITVSLDPKNEIVETDETNNTAFIKVGVNDRPRAILTAVPMSVLTNETVTFDGSLSWDFVGGVTEYNFSFGDNINSGWITSPTADHSYPEDGLYTASLVARDPDGAVSKRVNLTVTVVNRAPVASPSSNLTRALTFTPILFVSNATDPDGYVTTEWYFGDGDTDDRLISVHAYAKSGTYKVKLDVEDDDGASSSYDLNVLILNRPPTCTINASTVIGNIKTGFSLNAEAVDLDGTIVSYKWDMGDGSLLTDQLAEHRYNEPGVYAVTLTVVDDEGAQGSKKLNITLIDEPPTGVGEALLREVLTFEKVSFNGSRSGDMEGPITYAWDFGDGNTSTEMSPNHAYYKIGNYTATLTVRDTAAQTDSTVLLPIIVNNRPPDAELSLFGNFSENGTIYYDGTNSTDPEGDISYFWNFGDDSTSTGPIAKHSYSEAGEYMVYLTVTDSEGGQDTVQYLVTVNAPPPKPLIVEDPVEEEDGYPLYVNALMLTNIIWIILLAIIIFWALARKKKDKKDEGEAPVPAPTVEPGAMPTQDYYGGQQPFAFPETAEQQALPPPMPPAEAAPFPGQEPFPQQQDYYSDMQQPQAAPVAPAPMDAPAPIPEAAAAPVAQEPQALPPVKPDQIETTGNDPQ